MNTPSHFLMTAALEKACPRLQIAKGAFLLGAVAPDLPLWIISLISMLYYHLILGWKTSEAFRFIFRELYFHNPIWIISHNFLHAPVLLLIGFTWVWSTRRHPDFPSRWLLWFLLACLLHTLVDIFTHANDGPLIFFPLEWTIRFQSPVSYWDPRHYGQEFGLFELALDSGLLIYLYSHRAVRWLGKLIRCVPSLLK